MKAKLNLLLTVALTATLTVILLISLSPIRAAQANDRSTVKKLKQMAREAMENYDLMEVEEAKRQLNRAIVLAKRKRMNGHPLTAQLYIHLGIVYFSGYQDVESAKVAFIDAVSIDPKIRLNPAYRTGEMDKLLAEAKREFGSPDSGGNVEEDRKPAPAPVADDVDCDELVGISHTLVDSADANRKKRIKAHVSADLSATKISMFYRPQGKSEFVEVKMKKKGSCAFVGTVPAKALNGEVVHYYLAVYNKGGKVIAKKGSSASPNIIEVMASSGSRNVSSGGGDGENPFGTRRRAGGSSGDNGGSVLDGPPSKSSIYVMLAVGSGGGYVQGQTEQEKQDVGCCFAPALFHVFPEIGYRLNAKSTIGLAARIGLPVGADLPGHATAAPAGMLVYRRSLSEDGGLELSGVLGGGIIRHAIPLAADMGTDTSAIGPLLVGAGVGYNMPFTDAMSFIAGLNLLAGIPIVGEIGTSPANFGLQIDANLGLQVGF